MIQKPRKRFGQHFLCDQGVIQRIVAALRPHPTQHLVEIGPGQGAITLPVAKLSHALEVIELDRDLIPEIRGRVPRQVDLTIHEADALTFDFAALKTDERLLRVFGNLPYNISTPLIFHLLEYTSIISDMLFMLQKEVADRMAAAPGSDAYGRLSVMVQYYCQVDLLFDVGPHAFYPPPKVQSSILRLLPHQTYPYVAQDEKLFAEVVKQAFSQRRKTLRNSLRNMVSDDVFLKVNIDSKLRAENLGVKEFVALSNALL